MDYSGEKPAMNFVDSLLWGFSKSRNDDVLSDLYQIWLVSLVLREPCKKVGRLGQDGTQFGRGGSMWEMVMLVVVIPMPFLLVFQNPILRAFGVN